MDNFFIVFLQECGLFLKDSGMVYDDQTEQDPAGFIEALIQGILDKFHAPSPNQSAADHLLKAALGIKAQQKVGDVFYPT